MFQITMQGSAVRWAVKNLKNAVFVGQKTFNRECMFTSRQTQLRERDTVAF